MRFTFTLFTFSSFVLQVVECFDFSSVGKKVSESNERKRERHKQYLFILI
jgi:hypothetical protein